MKYYIIAGEASGDLHGSNLMKELKKLDSEAEFRFWGGDLMETVGGQLVMHYRDIAFMGFIEVVKNLPTILKNLSFCKGDIQAFNPDVVILIDYPGFNLRIAEHVKSLGIPVHYYISPQIWAWKQNRVHKIKKIVDRMITILPFEVEFYKQFGLDVDYVGHPLLDAIGNREFSEERTQDLREEFGLDSRKVIVLLPGSRKQEVMAMLPNMLAQIDNFPDCQFVLAAASSLDDSFLRDIVNENDIKIIKNRSYDLLQISFAALVTSGTATLETALFKVPQVVCYKGSFISYHIAKRVIKVKYISLVNLILDREVVRELIQKEYNPTLLKEELGKLINEEPLRNKMISNFGELISILGGSGASRKAAKIIYTSINND